MRSFLALLPDTHLAMSIDYWSQQQYAAIDNRTSIQNLHVTVCFMGDISAKQKNFIKDLLDQSIITQFELELNTVGYFPDSGTLWLGSNSTPSGFTSLVKTCRKHANRAGIRVDKRVPVPHITLARRVNNPVAAAMLQPSFVFSVDELVLVESRLTPQGPIYNVDSTWIASSKKQW